MSFSFRFTSTHQDLLDAYAAQQRSRSRNAPVGESLCHRFGIHVAGRSGRVCTEGKVI